MYLALEIQLRQGIQALWGSTPERRCLFTCLLFEQAEQRYHGMPKTEATMVLLSIVLAGQASIRIYGL